MPPSYQTTRRRAEAFVLDVANAARFIEGQPALATLRFLQTLEASNAVQTFVMNDLSVLLPSLSSRGAKPSATEPGRNVNQNCEGEKRKPPAGIRLRRGDATSQHHDRSSWRTG